MSLNLSRKAGDITMIQNTLYNSGGYIKRSKLFIVLWASFVSILFVFQIFKKSKEDIYLGERIQVFRCFGYTRIKIE